MYTLLRGILFVFVLTLAWTAPSAAQVQDSVDVFTGDHYIHSDSLRRLSVERFKGYDVGMEARYTKQVRAGTRWALSFYAYSARGTTLRDAREMYFVADGERVRPYDTERDIYREEHGRYTMLVEKQTGLFKRSAYETLASADSVRVKVGDAIFTVPKESRRDMELILSRVSPY
jgi:hypothetical protein